MTTLYITEQNSILRKTGERLILQKDETVLLDIQCHRVDAVLLFGNVQFTTQAVHQLFEHGIEMALFTRSGNPVGHIASPMTKNITLRLAQFRKYDDNDFRLEISKTILEGKLRNSRALIRTQMKNKPGQDFSEETEALSRALKRVSRAETLSELFGIEGDAASHYFQALGQMVLPDFQFASRSRRPPQDPANALLSLTYTMIFNGIVSILDGLGFDPYLGFFHHPQYGRASLAADLMEEFRAPAGDRLVLNLINRKVLKIGDFYQKENGAYYLRREPMKTYFERLESHLTTEFVVNGTTRTFRKAFRHQAEKMARTMLDKDGYTPFLM